MNLLNRRSLLKAAALLPGYSTTALGLGAVLNGLSFNTFAQQPSKELNQPNASTEPEIIGLGKPQHVLILPPSGSGPFAWASQALKAGFVAAHARDGRGLPVLIIEAGDKPAEMSALYADLQRQGILQVVGPLTRNAINAVIDAGVMPIPTLALNQPDPDRNIPSFMVLFGLPIEGEARQIANVAYDDATIKEPYRRPLIAVAVTSPNPVARRATATFIDTWRELGGDIPLPIEFENRPTADLTATIAGYSPDCVFLGGAIESLRTVRPALDKAWPLYGTSMLMSPPSTGLVQANYAVLNQIRINELERFKVVEMPWLVQADHLAVMAYPRPPAKFHFEMQKLYALGVDAYRLTFDTFSDRNKTELDGVTGRLRLNRTLNRVDRNGVVLQFKQGSAFSADRPQ
jgi:uncharacterized protein